jgi:hypothetical protein
MTGDPRELRPPIAAAYAETVATVLEGGIVDRSLKELCFRAVAGEDVEGADERERAALDWAYAITYLSARGYLAAETRSRHQTAAPSRPRTSATIVSASGMNASSSVGE